MSLIKKQFASMKMSKIREALVHLSTVEDAICLLEFLKYARSSDVLVLSAL